MDFDVFACVVAAPVSEGAVCAFRGACRADVAAMEYQPVVGYGPQVFWNIGFEIFLYCLYCLAVGEAEAVRYSEHMCVYGDYGLLVYYRGNDICSFAADAWKRHQVADRGWHFAAEIGNELPGHSNQVFRLAVRVGNALDVGEHLVECGSGKLIRRGECLEERRSDHVHSPVRALCAKNDRNEQLEWRVIMQLRLCHWMVLLKPIQYIPVSFFLKHIQLEIVGAVAELPDERKVLYGQSQINGLIVEVLFAALAFADEDPAMVVLKDIPVVSHHHDGSAVLLIDFQQ